MAEQRLAQPPLPDAGTLARPILAGWETVFASLPVGAYVCDRAGLITQYNDRAAQLWGRRPVHGDPAGRFCGAFKAFHETGEPMFAAASPMSEALREARPVRDREVILERPDGGRSHVLVSVELLLDDDGALAGAVNALVDISDRKSAEDRQRLLLLDELNHRVKNTLATVQSLAAHSLRGDSEPREMRATFEARLMALSSAHNQLAERHWTDADLRTLVRDAVAPYRPEGEDLRIEGDDVRLSARGAVALAMVVHELATNAAKFGALSTPDGRLCVAWRIETEAGLERLALEWREEGGPAVEPPIRRGFGARFIESAVERELGGKAAHTFARDGVRCRVVAPLAEVAAT